MNMVKSLLAGLTILTLSYSANVTISGIVTDTAGTAIAGASVKLLFACVFSDAVSIAGVPLALRRGLNFEVVVLVLHGANCRCLPR